MRVLVLGGTGAMGKHLVHLLVEEGKDVHVTSRTRSGMEAGVHYIQGNAQDLNFLMGILTESWDSIVDFMVYTTPIFQKRYSYLLNATKQYVFISSARVYANSEEPIKECSPRLLDVVKDDGYLKTDEYALTKARQEDLLLASQSKNWTIIRPYITYDDERLQLGVLEKEDWLYRALNGRSIVTAQDIQNKSTTLTAGRDVAYAICSVIGKQEALGEAFHITGNKNVTWKEILNIYLEVLKKQGFNTGFVEQSLNDFLTWRKGRYQVIYDRLFNRIFDNSKINDFADTSRFIAPKEGLSTCLTSFLNRKPWKFKSPNWQEEALKDRVLNESTRLSEIPGIKQKLKYQIFKSLPEVGRILTK